MKETTHSSPQSLLKILAALGALTLICCAGVLCYWAALYFAVDNNISLLPTATLNPACEESDCLNACIRRLPNFDVAPLSEHWFELAEKEGGYEIARYKLNEKTGQLERVATPTVPDYLMPYQADIELHRRIWNYFTDIFPNYSNVNVSYMIVVMDASTDRYAASVRELDSKWRLYINLLDFNVPSSVIDVLTHEYGHILTLNKTQVKYIDDEYWMDRDQTEFDSMHAACKGLFFNGFSCASEKAYLNVFGNRFWNGELYETWTRVFLMADNNDEAVYKTALDEFYEKHHDQFVSSYAATNPREDIAESWTEFIMRPKPFGTSIADQKVLFFYEFPELVELRSEIIHSVCQYAIAQK